MLVRDLVLMLEGYDPDTIVVLSSDGEGNTYSPLGDVVEGHYIPDSTWSGEVWYPEDEDVDWDDDEDGEWDDTVATTPPEDAVEAIVLYPVN